MVVTWRDRGGLAEAARAAVSGPAEEIPGCCGEEQQLYCVELLGGLTPEEV